MADLVMNDPREFQGQAPSGSQIRYPIPAGAQAFEGSAMKFNAAGEVVNCAPEVGAQFAGFNTEHTDARPATYLADAGVQPTVQLQTKGLVWLTVTKGTNWSAGDTGLDVFATTGNDFSTVDPGDAQKIGKTVKVENIDGTAAKVLVAFAADPWGAN